MKDNEKSKKQLINELVKLRQQIAELETDHGQTTKLLSESEERYRAIIEAFDGLIYVCSQDNRVEFMNARFVERTGYDPTGELCYKAIHDLDEICPWCVNEQVFKGEKIRWEVQSPKDDRWYYIVNTPIYHPDESMSKMAMILDITERKQSEEALLKSEKWLTRIKESFLNFGTDPIENINLLTMLCGELMGATCALYNRLDRGLLCSWGQWNPPPEYKPVNKPDGHICYDVIKTAGDEILVISDLPATRYAQSDPYVLSYKLQTYVGRAVKLSGTVVGSLSVFYQDDFVLGETDKRAMEIIAAAIGVEEERKQAEESLRKTNRAFKALSDCNQAVLHAANESELLQEVCRIIKDDCGYHTVWVGLTEQDEAKTVRPVIKVAYDTGYLNTVNTSLADVELDRGSTGTAIRTREPVINRDILTNSDYASWRAEAIKLGYASSAALPLISHEQVIGALNVYAVEPDAFDSEEVDLLMELAGDLAHGITAHRVRAEHVRAQAALQVSEVKYRRLFESLVDVFYQTDNAGNITMVSPSITRISGYRPEEVIGLDLRNFYVNPEDRDKLIELISKHGFVENFEVQLKKKDGSILWMSSSARLSKDKDDNIIGVEGIARDVTEHKKAEESLRRERERLSTVLDGNPIPIFMIDQDHRIVFWNRGVETLTLVSREHALGKTLGESLRPAYADNPPLILADLILDMTDEEMIRDYGHKIKKAGYGEAFEATTKIWPNGDKRILDIIATRIRDHLGNVVGAIQCAQDITDKKRLHDQLLQSQKMETIGTLAGGIAHDFNNILSAIIGYTEMAKHKLPEDSPVQHNLRQVLDAGSRATELVRQILTFSRQTEHEKRPMQLAPAIKEALKLLRSSLPSTIEIRSDIDISMEEDMVQADPTQIHQVLMNLCTNAAFAMRDKGHMLRVKLEALAVDDSLAQRHTGLSQRPYVCLTVSDTGHGIEANIIDRIFDPYFTTKGPGEGTGMGLAIVQGIVKSHGGEITVTSEPEQGTTFRLFFPRIEEKISANIEEKDFLPTGKEHILFVDDESNLVELGQEMLKSLGYSVTAKTSSIEALDAFRAAPDAFDLVITDMTMPGLTGGELAKELMAIRSNLPIILCTGFSEIITKEQAKAMGIKEFIMKPIVMREVGAIIRRVIDQSTDD